MIVSRVASNDCQAARCQYYITRNQFPFPTCNIAHFQARVNAINAPKVVIPHRTAGIESTRNRTGCEINSSFGPYRKIRHTWAKTNGTIPTESIVGRYSHNQKPFLVFQCELYFNKHFQNNHIAPVSNGNSTKNNSGNTRRYHFFISRALPLRQH